MSYRTRRPRSRTPPPAPRIRPETTAPVRNSTKSFDFKPRSITPPTRTQDSKKSRDRDIPKRDRWEPRRRTRSRSPRSRGNSGRSNSLEKRGGRNTKFEPPLEINQNLNAECGKPVNFSAPDENSGWQDPIDCGPRFVPNDFRTSQFSSKDNTFDPPLRNDLWKPNEGALGENVIPEYNMTPNIPSLFSEKPKISTPPINQQTGNAAPLYGQSKMMGADFTGEQPKEEQGPTVPEFNPETSKLTSQEWIKLIETTAKDRDWKPDEKIYVLSSRLAGFARQWYLNTGIKCATWIELKSAFFVAFPSENDYYSVLKKMFYRVKDDGESITQYFHHKVALLNACDIYGRKAVSCIVAGLPNGNLREDAKGENFDDPDLLYQYLRAYSDSTQKKNDPDEKKVSLESKKSVNTNQRCFFCKQKGHILANCDERYRSELEAQRYSELNAKGLTTSNNVMQGSLSQTPTFNKFFTEVVINGVPMRGYVDQTSHYCTIREESAAFLKMSMIKQKSKVIGFAGQSVTSTGFLEVPICIDRAISNIKLFVVPNYVQIIPVVIGQNFINQPHIVVMKDGDQVRFYQRMESGQQANFDF